MCCAATQHHSFRFPGIELYLDQRVAAHRRHLFDHALTERLMYHAVTLLKSGAFGADRTVFGFSGAARFAAPVRPVRAA